MGRPDTWHRPAYLPSLLDRLQDHAPQQRSERPEAYAPDGEGMRRIIQRDLALLLNTTNLDDEFDTGRYPAVAGSVVNYGVPALSGAYVSDRNWGTIEKLIRAAITRFEPRLIAESLSVRQMLDKDATRYNQLMFEIRGLVHWSPYPLEFRIQSTYDLELNKVTLNPRAHARNEN